MQMNFHIIYELCQILIVFSIYVQNQINNVIEQRGWKKNAAIIKIVTLLKLLLKRLKKVISINNKFCIYANGAEGV